jgi:hypothetical protein
VEGSGRRLLGGLYNVMAVAGHYVCKCKEGDEVGAEDPKLSYCARFGAAFGLHGSFGGAVGLQHPLP